MFAQVFLLILGLIGVVLGLKTGDYLWALCGLGLTLSFFYTLYQLKAPLKAAKESAEEKS